MTTFVEAGKKSTIGISVEINNDATFIFADGEPLIILSPNSDGDIFVCRPVPDKDFEILKVFRKRLDGQGWKTVS